MAGATCALCGAMIAATMTTCSNCGTGIGETDSKVVPDPDSGRATLVWSLIAVAVVVALVAWVIIAFHLTSQRHG